MPSKTLTERMEEDHVPYDIWVKKGYVTLTNGPQNAFSHFINLIRIFDIRPLWVGYNPWYSQYWVKEMEEQGFTMEKVR